MSVPANPPRLPLLALGGVLAGVVAALTVGELVWYVLAPEPPEQRSETQLDSPQAEPFTPPRGPRAEPRLAITAAPVAVYPGGKNAFGVRVRRDQFDGPVTVRFESADGLSAAEVTIPAGSDVGATEVTAAADAKPGTYTLTASARTAADPAPRARTSVAVTVLAVPAAARLAVSVSPKVTAYQKGKNAFAVRVARAEFDEPVTVTFDGLPDGVTIPSVTIPAGKTDVTVELTAAGAAKLGAAKVTATAKAASQGTELSATADVAVEVLDADRAPLDVVLVVDCTGSMAKSVAGLRREWNGLAAALAKAKFDVRYGLVGFRDTTLGQPLVLPSFRGEPMTAAADWVPAALRDLRFGGGGGDGESSLDGLAAAADYPLRVGAAARVLILITDGPPKRVDRRVRSVEDAVGHLRARRIDQLQIVALPEHRKRFEPLWGNARGTFFDLKDATERDGFGPLTADLAKAIVEAIPARPEPKPEPTPPAPGATLPEPKAAEVPAPPAAREPDEPQLAPPAPAAPLDPPTPEVRKAATEVPAKPRAAWGVVTAWAAAVACVAALLLFFGEMLLPGERPGGAALATGYCLGVPVGLAAGALGFVALDAVGIPVLARVGAATLFGLLLGLAAAGAELVFRAEVSPPDEPRATPRAPTPPPLAKSRAAMPKPPIDLDLPTIEAPTATAPKPNPAPLLDLDLPPVEAYPSAAPKAPAAPPHKPNITGAPKPGDGCPGCGRKIPGATGSRYCMVCDQTF